jgi:hypothetical protein
VLEHDRRDVLGLVLGSQRPDPAAGPPALQRRQRRGRGVLLRLRVGGAAQDRVAQGGDRSGHLVQRRRGHDEQAEAGEQHQHRDGHPRREPALQRVAEQEADDPALVGAGLGALHDVEHAEAAEGEREPADDQAAEAALGVAVLARGGEHAPGAEQQQRRQEQRPPAEHRRQPGVDGRAGPDRRATTRHRP